MVPYFFFMSYARLDEIEKKHYLKKLFDRITGEVARNAGGTSRTKTVNASGSSTRRASSRAIDGPNKSPRP